MTKRGSNTPDAAAPWGTHMLLVRFWVKPHPQVHLKQEGRLHDNNSISRGHLRDKTGQVCSHRHCFPVILDAQTLITWLMYQNSFSTIPMCFKKIPSAENEHSFWWKPIMDFYVQIMDFTYKAALGRNIQKGALCLHFPICLVFYFSFYFKIVHFNSTALSLQHYICTSLSSHLSTAKEVQRKKTKLQLVILRAVLQWLGFWVLQQQRNELPKWILNYTQFSKYSSNNRFEREQTFWSGTIVIFCQHQLTAHQHSQSHVFKQIPGKQFKNLTVKPFTKRLWKSSLNCTSNQLAIRIKKRNNYNDSK